MIQTLQARNITLRELIDRFNLQLVRDEQFFREWQADLPDISDLDRQLLDKVKEGYFNLVESPPFLGKSVQISVLSPILLLANFFLPPFQIRAEQSVELLTENEGLVIKGQIDVFVLKEQVWVAVIESKEAFYSLEAGLAQLLAYMLSNPNLERPGFGMITNGGSFLFIKSVKADHPQYATSKVFEVRNPGNELYDVLKILKRLGQL